MKNFRRLLSGLSCLLPGLLLAVLFRPVLAADPGTLKWSNYHNATCSPAIGTNGTLYVLAGNVTAVDPASGNRLWYYSLGNTPTPNSELTIGADGTIYACTSSSTVGRVFAITPDNTLKWIFEAGTDSCYDTAIAADGTIYVSTTKKMLYAVNAADGAKKWEQSFPANVPRPAVGADGTIYVGANEYKGMFYALDPLNGNIKHSYQTNGPDDYGSNIYTRAAIGADGVIYIGTTAGNVFALNPDLSVKWKQRITSYNPISTSPALGPDGTIYVGGTNKLYALNPVDGSKKWDFTPGDQITSSPLVGADGTIYLGSWDKKVYALDPANGGKKWDFLTQTGISPPMAMGSDGTLYVVSLGTVYAFYTSSGGLAASPWPMYSHDPKHSGRAGGAAPGKNVAPANSLLLD